MKRQAVPYRDPSPFQAVAALLGLLAAGVLGVAVVWGLLVLLLAMA